MFKLLLALAAIAIAVWFFILPGMVIFAEFMGSENIRIAAELIP